MLGPRKDQRPSCLVPVEQADQQALLVVLGDEVNRVAHFVSDFARLGDLNPNGVRQVTAGQLSNRLGHGGRKHHCLAIFTQGTGDAAQGMSKSDIQHLIGFIQDEELGFRQADRVPIQQINQPARRGNQNVGPPRKLLFLHVDGLAANDQPDPQIRRDALQRLNDLVRELSGRAEDQPAHAKGADPLVLLGQRYDQGNAKGCGFARARLCNPQNVALCERVRDCFFLNRGWCR
ncbi:MAG: Uncharacterised protein [Pseudidiomarina mangrovi]|nr:MAG: Uncharacterised protein [Pseudidiomarina mangrovi]